MLGNTSQGFEPAGQRGGQLGVDEEAHVRAPKDRVVALTSRKLQDSGDVLGFQIRIIRKNLVVGRASRQEIENVFHPDSETADAGTPSAHTRVNRNPIDRAHVASHLPC